MLGELAVIEAVGRLHGLAEDLEIGVRVGRQIVAERVDALALGLGLVLLEERLDALEVQRGLRHPEIVVDDAVKLRPQRRHDGRILQPHHAAAEQLGFQPHLGRRLDHADRVRRVGADIDHVRLARLDGADDRREVGGLRMIAAVIDDLETVILGVDARALDRVLRELGIGADQRDRLRLGILRHCQLEEAARPVGDRLRPGRQDLEIAVVVELVVHRETEQGDEGQVALHHDRHRRRDQVGAVARYHEVDLVDVEQLGVDAGHSGRVGLIVVIDQLDLAAEQPAGRVDVLLPDLHRDQGRLAGAGEPAGERHREPDLDRLGGLRRRGGDQRGRSESGGAGQQPALVQ